MSCGPQCNEGSHYESLQIQQCGPFLQDRKFNTIKDSLPPNWTQAPCACGEEEALNANMDNVTFHNDRFELVVNVKGYEPQQIRCNVTCDKIELVAKQPLRPERAASGVVQRNRSMNRSYELPQNINPNEAYCFLSSDGILVVVAPWSRSL